MLLFNNCVENLEPEVKIMSLSIQSPGRPDIVLPIPVIPNSKGLWFTLKEGSQYKLKFTFSVNNNIVSGLRYINAVWKTGVKGELACLFFVVLHQSFDPPFVFCLELIFSLSCYS